MSGLLHMRCPDSDKPLCFMCLAVILLVLHIVVLHLTVLHFVDFYSVVCRRPVVNLEDVFGGSPSGLDRIRCGTIEYISEFYERCIPNY